MAGSEWPMSLDQESGTSGSITTFEPAGTCDTIQARVRLREPILGAS